MPTISTTSSQTERNIFLQENKLVLLWSFTTLLVVMNTTMFNVALPFVLEDFSLSSSTASWLVSGYSVMFAISTITFSRLSDFIPLSRLLLYGISILGIASIIGFFAINFFMLLGARILQAAGAGSVAGLGVIMAGRYIPVSRRGKAMAMIGSGASLAFGLGPVLGGVITQFLGWNFLFIVTGISVFCIPFLHRLLPKETMKKGHFDYAGAVITALSFTSLLLFLSTFSIVILISTFILFIVWWLYLHKTKEPFIPPSLFGDKQYTKLLFIGNTAFFINFSNLFIMPIILASIFGISPAGVGMIIFPGAILAVIVGPFIGRMIDRYSSLPIIIAGQLLLLSGAILFAFFATKHSYFILAIYIFASIGFNALSSSVSNEITRILAPEQIGSGIGLSQLIQFLGGALGVTISGFLLTAQQNMPFESMYRNIFTFYSFIILLAIGMFILYYKNAKQKKPGIS